MPIYEYRCKQCGVAFERMRRVSDDTPVLCGECGSVETEKLLSKTSFVLKGSGWYVTDYARSSDGQPKSGEPKSDTPAAGTDTKTATTEGTTDSTSPKTPAKSDSVKSDTTS